MAKKIFPTRLGTGLFQLIVMLISALAASLLPLLLPDLNVPLKVILQWIMLPLLGALTSGLFARAGVTYFLAWLMPPVIVSAVPWLVIGYPLEPGVMLLCCLTSMIGASTGEVLKRRAHERRE